MSPTKQRKAPPLWALRTPIPEGTRRLLGLSAVSLVLLSWCLCSYVTVTRNGHAEPLISHFFLPPPDEVIRSLIYLTLEKQLLQAVGVSAVRILIAFALSLALALPLGILM